MQNFDSSAMPAAGRVKPVVALRGITKRYADVVANDGIDLDFFAGEVHVLLGENGAGKSTLISILSGMVRPDEGEVLIEGQAVQIGSPREALGLGIGTVYQHPMLVPTMTVLQNLMLGEHWSARVEKTSTVRRLEEFSDILGISLDPHVRMDQLSIGQQQYVEIIKALWKSSKILILDESTVMLTPKGVEDLLAVVSRLRDAGLGIVFITHKLSDAVTFGDRVSVIKRGRNAGSIDPNELRANSQDQTIHRIVEMMFGAADDLSSERNTKEEPECREQAPVLVVDRISVAGRADEVVVEELSFDLRPGEILGIAGVEGNGQKPFAEALAGQRKFTSGRLVLEGQDVTGMAVRQRQQSGIRYVTDDRLGEGTIGDFDVSTNLLIKRIGSAPFWRRGIQNREKIDAHAAERVRDFDIRTPGVAQRVATLSGGNIQKVMLARELEGRPRVVIFNKPTYGLDRNNIASAHRAIADQAASGVGTIVISSDLDEILALSNRVAVMLRGRIVGIVPNGPDARRRIGQMMIGHINEVVSHDDAVLEATS